jgi:hypothetical protein
MDGIVATEATERPPVKLAGIVIPDGANHPPPDSEATVVGSITPFR